MVRRNEKRHQIVISTDTFDRFLAYRKTGETEERVLLNIMDLADKAKRFSAEYRNKEK